MHSLEPHYVLSEKKKKIFIESMLSDNSLIGGKLDGQPYIVQAKYRRVISETDLKVIAGRIQVKFPDQTY